MRKLFSLRFMQIKVPKSATVYLLFLGLFYLLGGLFGVSFAAGCDDASRTSLGEYIREYCSYYGADEHSFSLLDCIRLYFGDVCLVFLLGFSSLGCILIPAVSGWMGFSSFYTATCFAQTFGQHGILAAAALILVRLLFTVPSFFSIAVCSWRNSLRFASLAFGRAAKPENIYYPTRYFLMFILCLAVLCVGVCCERLFTPKFFAMVTERINLNF